MVRFSRNGESGNIFFIMGMACTELEEKTAEEMIDRVEASDSYNEALDIIGQYVELEEVDSDDDV